MNYTFTKYFHKGFYENTGITLDEDKLAYILMVCKTSEPHKKIDDKGRPSAYFTCILDDILVTLVCDYDKKKIITGVKETRKRRTC